MHPDVTLVAPEECLALYAAMQAEELVPIVFYDAPMDAASFMQLMHSSIMLRVEVQGTLMAAAWLRDVQGRTASLHFCFFRAGRKDAVELGRASLGYIFSTSALQSLYGLTPKVYRAAVHFAQAVGGQILGEVAGACVLHHRGGRIVPGVISTFNPKEYCMGGGGGKGGGGGDSTAIMREQMAQQQRMHEEQMAQMEAARAAKPQTAKPVTEAATAARQAQKEKAAKASGIAGSIHTNPLAGGADKGVPSGKTLLGQ